MSQRIQKQLPWLQLERCAAKFQSLLLCKVYLTHIEVKAWGVNLAQPVSIDCGPNYAGWYEVHTAGSWFSGGKGTVTGDVWPIFSSSKHICSAQELHQLCLYLSPPFPSLWFSLSPRPFSWCVSFSFIPQCGSASLPPLSGSSLLLLLFLLHSPACSTCVGVTDKLRISQTALNLCYGAANAIKQHLPESLSPKNQLLWPCQWKLTIIIYVKQKNMRLYKCT